MCRKVTSITHVYFDFYFRRPSLSSLSWSWVGGHDCFMDATARAGVARCLILCDILTGAPLLVIAFALIACCAGVPDGDVVPAREAIVVVVVPLVGVGWRIATASRGGRGWGVWDAGNQHWHRCSWWGIVVASSSISISSAPASTSASTASVALVVGCWWWCRCIGIYRGWGYCGWCNGQHGQLLLRGCKFCT